MQHAASLLCNFGTFRAQRNSSLGFSHAETSADRSVTSDLAKGSVLVYIFIRQNRCVDQAIVQQTLSV